MNTPESPSNKHINNIMTSETPRPTDEHCSLFVYGSLTIRDPDSQEQLLKTPA